MADPSPSPYDVLKRWPLAVMALSVLCMQGDEKYRGLDGRGPSRGSRLDDEYDSTYSDIKRARHEARRYAGEEFDDETKATHRVPELWHAINALESELRESNYVLDDIIHRRHLDGYVKGGSNE